MTIKDSLSITRIRAVFFLRVLRLMVSG